MWCPFLFRMNMTCFSVNNTTVPSDSLPHLTWKCLTEEIQSSLSWGMERHLVPPSPFPISHTNTSISCWWAQSFHIRCRLGCESRKLSQTLLFFCTCANCCLSVIYCTATHTQTNPPHTNILEKTRTHTHTHYHAHIHTHIITHT